MSKCVETDLGLSWLPAWLLGPGGVLPGVPRSSLTSLSLCVWGRRSFEITTQTGGKYDSIYRERISLYKAFQEHVSFAWKLVELT